METVKSDYGICEGCKWRVLDRFLFKGFWLCNWCRFVENIPSEVKE